MINWIKLRLEHKQLIDEHLKNFPIDLSDYCFTNLWMWDELRNYQFAVHEEQLCLRGTEHGSDFFLYPVGPLEKQNIFKILQDEQRKKDQLFYMRAIPEEALKYLLNYPLTEEPQRFDYVYLYQDLLLLPGNRFQAKRNLINQFKKLYAYTVEKIDPINIDLVLEYHEEWYLNQGKGVLEEFRAVKRALKDFFTLKLTGCILSVDQKVIAFSFAEKIRPDIWLIHVEKANINFKGAYQMINNENIRLLSPTEYVNREESLGIESLAKAKNSYHPIRLLKKWAIKGL